MKTLAKMFTVTCWCLCTFIYADNTQEKLELEQQAQQQIELIEAEKEALRIEKIREEGIDPSNEAKRYNFMKNELDALEKAEMIKDQK